MLLLARAVSKQDEAVLLRILSTHQLGSFGAYA